jgi:hypothetical protein
VRFKLQNWFLAAVGIPLALHLPTARMRAQWWSFLEWECAVTDTTWQPGTPAYWDLHNQKPGTP